MLGRTVSPSDCALALAIPLCQEEFLADLADSANKDFAKAIRRGLPLRGPELFARVYEPLLRLILEIREEVAALGVTVYSGIRSSDLAIASSKHQVITLVAHWRFATLCEHDVLDFACFSARLAEASRCPDEARHPILTLLLKTPAVVAAQNAKQLAAALNELFLPTQRYYESSFEYWNSERDESRNRPVAAGITRVHLEEFFAGCFQAGACLELSDGLCTMWQFIEAMAPGFDGILDMTVCHSMIYAEVLRRHRHNCHVICNKQAATLFIRLIIFRHVMRDLARRPQPIEEAVANVHQSLLAELGRKVK
jgi:hypothetical protein